MNNDVFKAVSFYGDIRYIKLVDTAELDDIQCDEILVINEKPFKSLQKPLCSSGLEQTITQRCPCNILQYCTAVKLVIFL